MSTGFSRERAEDHDGYVSAIVAGLEQRGYRPREVQPEGDRPDIRIYDHRIGSVAWVDIKTRTGEQQNWAIKVGSFTTYWNMTIAGEPVYIVLVDGDATVDNVYTMLARITGPRNTSPRPLRATGRGSNTDFMLFRPGGTPFADWFVPALQGVPSATGRLRVAEGTTVAGASQSALARERTP